jgi:ABC-2 type transport system permease protein
VSQRFAGVARSEWTKFRSVRSTYWTFLVAALLGVGLGVLGSALSANHYRTDPSVHFDWNPVQRSLLSLELAQLAFAVLGVINVTSEYSTGMVRTSLAAVPKRVRMISAKLAVFTVAALVVGEAIAFAAFGLGQAVIHGKAPSASLGQHDVARAVIGAGLYLVVIGIMSAGFGVLLRHAASGIAVVVAMLFIVPGLVEAALPQSWSQPIEKYWPTNAGQRIIFFHSGGDHLSAWTGFGEFLLFAVVVVAVSLVFLERRDA